MSAPPSSNLRPKPLTRNPLAPWKRFFDDNINSMIECGQRKASHREENLQEDENMVSTGTNLQQVSISNTPCENDTSDHRNPTMIQNSSHNRESEIEIQTQIELDYSQRESYESDFEKVIDTHDVSFINQKLEIYDQQDKMISKKKSVSSSKDKRKKSKTENPIVLISEEINSTLMDDNTRDVEAISAGMFRGVSENCLSVYDSDMCHSNTLCDINGRSPKHDFIISSQKHKVWTEKDKRSKFTDTNFDSGKECNDFMNIDQDTPHIFGIDNHETRNSKAQNYLNIWNGEIIPTDPPRTTLQSHTIETPLQTDAPDDIRYLDNENSSRTMKTCPLFEQLGFQDRQHNEELLKNVDAPLDIKAGGDNRMKEDDELQCVLGSEGVNVVNIDRKQYNSLDHVVASDGFSCNDGIDKWMSENQVSSELQPPSNNSNEETGKQEKTKTGKEKTEENDRIGKKNTNTLHSQGDYQGDVEITTLRRDASSKVDISRRSGNVKESVPTKLVSQFIEMDTKASGDWLVPDRMDSALRQSEEMTSLDIRLASPRFSQSMEDCCVQESSSTHDSFSSSGLQSCVIVSSETQLRSPRISQSKEDCSVGQERSSSHASICSSELQLFIHDSDEIQLTSSRFSQSKEDCSVVQERSSTHDSICSSELQLFIHDSDEIQLTSSRFSQSKEDCSVVQERSSTHDSICSAELQSPITDLNEETETQEEKTDTEEHEENDQVGKRNTNMLHLEGGREGDIQITALTGTSENEYNTLLKEMSETPLCTPRDLPSEPFDWTDDSIPPLTFDTSIAINDPTLSYYFESQKGKREVGQHNVIPTRKRSQKRTKHTPPVTNLASDFNGLPHVRIKYSQSRFNTEKNVFVASGDPVNQMISGTENVLLDEGDNENQFETVSEGLFEEDDDPANTLISARTNTPFEEYPENLPMTSNENVLFDEVSPQNLPRTSKENVPNDEDNPENLHMIATENVLFDEDNQDNQQMVVRKNVIFHDDDLKNRPITGKENAFFPDPEDRLTAGMENGFLKEDSQYLGPAPNSLTIESKSLSIEDLSMSSIECLLEQLIQRGTVDIAFVMDLHGAVLAQSKNASISRPDAKAFFDALRGHYMGLMRIEACGNVYMCFKSADGSMLMGTCKEWVSVSRRGDNAIVVGFSRTATSGSSTCITEMTELSRVLNGWSL